MTLEQDSAAIEGLANVTQVSVPGAPGAYNFSVTVQSPDTGCDQYADWWEIVSPDENLIYRRVLFHSHVGEQPFSRSGGPVAIGPEETVIVRAHMSTTGYGGTAWRGNVAQGFEQVELELDFASNVQAQQPLPSSCAF